MDNRPIGIFDSGLGGLTVAKEIYRLLPHESTIYVGDTARVPYGNRSQKIVTHFSTQIVNFLSTQNVKAVVIACSTATSQALPELKKKFNFPIFGVVQPAALKALQSTKNNHIGVIGTKGTIESGSFQKILEKNNSEIQIETQTCPLFVPLAEEGMIRGKIAHSVVEHYLDQFRTNSIDTLILGCTHYPLLQSVIQSVLGDKITLINPGIALAETLITQLQHLGLTADNSQVPKHTYYVSDAVASFTSHAESFLGKALDSKAKLISFTDNLGTSI